MTIKSDHIETLVSCLEYSIWNDREMSCSDRQVITEMLESLKKPE